MEALSCAIASLTPELDVGNALKQLTVALCWAPPTEPLQQVRVDLYRGGRRCWHESHGIAHAEDFNGATNARPRRNDAYPHNMLIAQKTHLASVELDTPIDLALVDQGLVLSRPSGTRRTPPTADIRPRRLRTCVPVSRSNRPKTGEPTRTGAPRSCRLRQSAYRRHSIRQAMSYAGISIGTLLER